MEIFSSESEMQVWLRGQLEVHHGLASLIANLEYLTTFKASNLEETRILASFKSCLSSLHINEIISDNDNISLQKSDSLKPDFLLYAAESEGIVIVELKNISGPTRQAGTELGAYACEVRTYIPFLSNADIFNVVISTTWPTLLRHFIFHEIFWEQKNIICLEPIKIGRDIRLWIKDISELLEADTATRISAEHLIGYQLCLYDYGLYGDNPDRRRLDKFIPQMKTALSVMATEGNGQNSHGFGFLWKDHAKLSLAPYSITMINFAPFQSIERFFHAIDMADGLTEIQERFFRLVQEQAPTGHGHGLEKIRSSGCMFLENFCKPEPEGFLPWNNLRDEMLKRGELLAFQGWGMFGEIFKERLISEYSSGNITLSATSAKLGLSVVEDLIDSDYEFIDPAHVELS